MKKGIIIICAVILVIGIASFIIFKTVLSSATVLSNPTSIGIISDSSPEFSFASTKAGTITYIGDCSSSTTTAVKGKNTVKFESLSDGNYSNCKIIVTSGNKESAPLSVGEFQIDSTKPVTTATTSYVNGNWAKSASIILSCSDSTTECLGEPYYKINSGSEQRGTLISLTKEGVYELEYWSVDNAGNEETHHTEFNNIKIYSYIPAPEITTDDGSYDDAFDLEYEATDSDDYCYYTIDDGDPQDYQACDGTFEDVSFDDDDEYEIIIYENSSVGRIGATDSITITWGTVVPDVSISEPDDGDEYNYTDAEDIEIELDYDDDDEILATCQYATADDEVDTDDLSDLEWSDFDSCNDTGIYLSDIFDDYEDNWDTLNDGDTVYIYVWGVDEDDNEGDADYITIDYLED